MRCAYDAASCILKIGPRQANTIVTEYPQWSQAHSAEASNPFVNNVLGWFLHRYAPEWGVPHVQASVPRNRAPRACPRSDWSIGLFFLLGAILLLFTTTALGVLLACFERRRNEVQALERDRRREEARHGPHRPA